MALGATVSTYVTLTTIASSAANTNNTNINSVETPTFTTIKQTAGTQGGGYCGVQQSNPTNGSNTGVGVPFVPPATNTPSSVTLTVITHTNAGSETAGSIRTSGFFFQALASATTNMDSICTFVMVGN